MNIRVLTTNAWFCLFGSISKNKDFLSLEKEKMPFVVYLCTDA